MRLLRNLWAIGLTALGTWPLASACSGNDGGSTPCKELCSCVDDEGGELSECLDRCEARESDGTATVASCKSELSSEGFLACVEYCGAFGDEGTGGGATGGRPGGATGGRPSGTGGSSSGGGPGGGTGAPSSGGRSGFGATGGAPNTSGGATGASCTNPEFPVFCPARNGVAAGCWNAGAVCSTVMLCPDGEAAACSTEGFVPDCETDKCALPDPCVNTSGSGPVCGQSLIGGKFDVLYWCLEGANFASDPCAEGCHESPAGQRDYCIGDDPCASAVIDGENCGANLSPNAQSNVLYTCQDQRLVSMKSCARCEPRPPGQADVCVTSGSGGSGG